MTKSKLKLLAVSGSLRASSSNNILLDAIAEMLPPGVDFLVYPGISRLPHFDDPKETPTAVEDWRKHLQEADAVLVCSPEYAFGLPGSLKNAFDWTVGSGEMVNKPLGLITASTGGDKAHAAWLQVFTALSASIPEGCALLISYIRSKLNADGQITDEPVRNSVKELITKLLNAAAANLKAKTMQ
jgi:chromate reductase